LIGAAAPFNMPFMGHVLGLLLGLASLASVQNDGFDCTERVELGEETFEANEVGATWHIFLPTRSPSITEAIYLSAYAWASGDEVMSRDLSRHLTPATFHIALPHSLRLSSTRVSLSVKDTAIRPLVRRSTVRGSRSLYVSIPVETLAGMLARGGHLAITITDTGGSELHRVTIPTMRVREALARLPVIHDKFRENIADPEQRCAPPLTIIG
jgi:hypothetical protein